MAAKVRRGINAMSIDESDVKMMTFVWCHSLYLVYPHCTTVLVLYPGPVPGLVAVPGTWYHTIPDLELRQKSKK